MIDLVEAQCLNYILNTKSMSFIIYNNLDETYFPTFLDEYRFIKSHYEKKLPIFTNHDDVICCDIVGTTRCR